MLRLIANNLVRHLRNYCIYAEIQVEFLDFERTNLPQGGGMGHNDCIRCMIQLILTKKYSLLVRYLALQQEHVGFIFLYIRICLYIRIGLSIEQIPVSFTNKKKKQRILIFSTEKKISVPPRPFFSSQEWEGAYALQFISMPLTSVHDEKKNFDCSPNKIGGSTSESASRPVK